MSDSAFLDQINAGNDMKPRANQRRETNPPDYVSRQVTAARRFYLDLRPKPNQGLTVVCGGWEECASDYTISRATFPYYAIEYVAAGRGELVLAGKKYALVPGTVFAYGPGVEQRITTSTESRLGKYFVDFTGRQALTLLRQIKILPGKVLVLGSTVEVKQAFDALIRLAHRHDADAQRAAQLQLELLLIQVRRGAQPGQPAERRAYFAFERCRRHLEANFLALRSIEATAEACHINVSYLTRLFARFHAQTPLRYLQRLQMQWAAERLDSTDCLVREVADELGIDPFQFSRVFKRVHGVSPSAFLEARG